MERLRIRSEEYPDIGDNEKIVLNFFAENNDDALVVCNFLQNPFGNIEIINDPDELYLVYEYEKRNDLVKLHIADRPYMEAVLDKFPKEGNRSMVEILLTEEFINTTEKIFLGKFKKSSLKENETLLEKVLTGLNYVEFCN